MIREYLKRVEAVLASYKWVKTVQVLRCDIIETEQEQILTYRFRVALEGNALLELMERVVRAKDKRDSRTMTLPVSLARSKWGADPTMGLRPSLPRPGGVPPTTSMQDQTTGLSLGSLSIALKCLPR